MCAPRHKDNILPQPASLSATVQFNSSGLFLTPMSQPVSTNSEDLPTANATIPTQLRRRDRLREAVGAMGEGDGSEDVSGECSIFVSIVSKRVGIVSMAANGGFDRWCLGCDDDSQPQPHFFVKKTPTSCVRI